MHDGVFAFDRAPDRHVHGEHRDPGRHCGTLAVFVSSLPSVFPVAGCVPDAWLMADADVVAAMAGSFLGKLPSELVGQLLAAGDRTDYPAAARSIGSVRLRGRCWSFVDCCAST